MNTLVDLLPNSLPSIPKHEDRWEWSPKFTSPLGSMLWRSFFHGPIPSIFRGKNSLLVSGRVINYLVKNHIESNPIGSVELVYLLGGGFKKFLFSPRSLVGRWSNLTNIFQRGWNHQPVYLLIYHKTSIEQGGFKDIFGMFNLMLGVSSSNLTWTYSWNG